MFLINKNRFPNSITIPFSSLSRKCQINSLLFKIELHEATKKLQNSAPQRPADDFAIQKKQIDEQKKLLDDQRKQVEELKKNVDAKHRQVQEKEKELQELDRGLKERKKQMDQLEAQLQKFS